MRSWSAWSLVTAVRAMSSMTPQQGAPSAAAHRFLVARHGETNFNAEGRIQGTLDSSQLTLRGIEQASGLGHHVATVEASRFIESRRSLAYLSGWGQVWVRCTQEVRLVRRTHSSRSSTR